MTIEAKVIADANNPVTNSRILTLQLKYPRFIHSEFMTHRMFSRNASSSRAIPFTTQIKSINADPAMPVYWGSNQPGMQAGEEIEDIDDALGVWDQACWDACKRAEDLHELGIHKQIVNRITEPWQHISVVVTSTEWDNFFSLRLHPDAQPEIQELARCMKEAIDDSRPYQATADYVHIPYWGDGKGNTEDTLIRDKIAQSVARCARVSYKNHDNTDTTPEKDKELHDKLMESRHMSPFEHVAMPITDPRQPGITHQDIAGNLWSNNFRGWIQYRSVVEVLQAFAAEQERKPDGSD